MTGGTAAGVLRDRLLGGRSGHGWPAVEEGTTTSVWMIRRSVPQENESHHVSSVGRSSPFIFSQYVSRKLDHLRSLPRGWDGDRAQPVTQSATWGMYCLLTQLGDARTVFPFLAPDGNGGVMAEWRAGEWRLEIEVSDAGDAYVYARTANGVLVDDDLVGSEMVDRVRRLLLELSADVRAHNPAWRRLFG
jgi:hypothetical protein